MLKLFCRCKERLCLDGRYLSKGSIDSKHPKKDTGPGFECSCVSGSSAESWRERFDEAYCCYPFLFYVQPSNIGQWLKQVNKFVDPKAGDLRLLMGHGASDQGIAHSSVWDFRNELQDDDAVDLSHYGILTTDGAMTGNVEKIIGK